MGEGGYIKNYILYTIFLLHFFHTTIILKNKYDIKKIFSCHPMKIQKKKNALLEA